MASLNTVDDVDIAGCHLLSDFISERQELTLISQIDDMTWDTRLKRRVQHYGHRYDYRARQIDKESFLGPLPNWLGDLSGRLCEAGIFSAPPDQVIVNEYQPGQGIAPHIDCVPCFTEVIASLSLAAGCIMEFTELASGSEKKFIYLRPRSLIALTKDARYRWRHAIAPRKSDLVDGVRLSRSRRLSLTFRKVRQG
jgi:alkylated DNA repair dioxygenase AlkB